jgi:hypothetical protein
MKQIIRKVDGDFLVYKLLLRCKDGKLRSALYVRRDEFKEIIFRSLVYGEYKVTVPEFGKIFAFRTLREAKKFSEDFIIYHEGESFEVWACRSSRAIKCPFNDLPYLESSKKALREFWASPSKYHYNMKTPEDTIICDDLRLMRKVELPEEI